ncbi:uncharacterized protein [Eurosta solidaginis]|uniref:uncharacterized protein isoform X1 n=1 Tax=Eurosta solidaginis TaxID=178769 RepID=UPI0035315486
MDELDKIVKQLRGDLFIDVFRDAGFTKESLLLLKSSHLDTLLGTANYGQRVIFEHNLLNWQNEQGVNLQTTVCGGAAILGDSIITETTLKKNRGLNTTSSHLMKWKPNGY